MLSMVDVDWMSDLMEGAISSSPFNLWHAFVTSSSALVRSEYFVHRLVE